MSKDTDTIVDRIHNPTRDQLDKYICESRPVIITGLVDDWPCTKKWLYPNYLIEKIGPETLVNLRTDFKRDFNDDNTEWLGKSTKIPFKQFMEHWLDLKNNPDKVQTADSPFYYLASIPLNPHFPSLIDDVIPPPHAAEQNKPGNLWIGNRGQVTPLHHDWSSGDHGMDGLHAMILGKKVFKLFDPYTNEKCFRRKRIWGKFHQSVVDIDNPDLEKHPEFKDAKFLEIELNPGEMLFIPKLWWHHVTTTEPAIAINFWFQHLGSEKLKLTKHWGHTEQYLLAVTEMIVTPEKMRTVIQYYLNKKKPTDVTQEEIDYYMNNPLQLMLQQKFLKSFGNIAYYNNPVLSGEEANQFAQQMEGKVEDWIRQKIEEQKQSAQANKQ